MYASKWLCMRVAHPWETMERSLSGRNNEKHEFGGGMNGKCGERSGFTRY